MLDHVFTDAIGALRDALEGALLERLALEERFHVDVLLGDTSWETSYALPGEGTPARVRADLTFDWPTWSQSAYRSWFNGEEPDEAPRIDITITLRVQHLEAAPDPRTVLAVLPDRSPAVGREHLDRLNPSVETSYDLALEPSGYAIEVCYEGGYELDDRTLTDGSVLDEHFSALGGWIASVLVRLGDLPLAYRPPDALR